MKIKTILNELKKGEKFSTAGKVVFTKPVKRFNGQAGLFYTQFVLLQDDSTGYAKEDEKLPIAITVKGPDDAIERNLEIQVDGIVDEYQGNLQYKGRIKDRIVNVGNSKKEAIQKQINELIEEMNKPKEEAVGQREKIDKTNSKFDEPSRIARSVAVKSAVDLVVGKAIPMKDFWTKCYEIEDYVLNGIQEQIEKADDTPEEYSPVPF